MATANPPRNNIEMGATGGSDTEASPTRPVGSPRRGFFNDTFTMENDTPIILDDAPAATFKAVPPMPTKPSVLDTKTSRKQLKQMTSIEQAKDRAQITASTAMSIVQVALLKDVLDAGPYGNKYYYWSLGFILTGLILQVFAGFIAIYIALLRYYYSEYKDDFLDDCCKTCCPWWCRRVPAVRNTVGGWVNSSISTVRNLKKKKKQAKIPTPVNAGEGDDDEDFDSDIEAGCCSSWECTTMRYADFEYEVLDLYDNMTEEVIKADLKTANFEIELKWLVDKVTRLSNELQKYEATDVADDSTNNEYLQKIRDQLQEAQAKREEMEARNRKAKRLRAQGAVLQHHVEIIQEERVMKRSTFWQNLLNMMLYTVFVLNAIIAGIGLANPQVPPPIVVNTTTA